MSAWQWAGFVLAMIVVGCVDSWLRDRRGRELNEQAARMADMLGRRMLNAERAIRALEAAEMIRQGRGSEAVAHVLKTGGES
jgi:hypothetical protein